jgi:hypothetical protein
MTWNRADAISKFKLVEVMPQDEARTPTIQATEPFSPAIDVPQKRRIADLLARQQEEYDEYLVERNANEMSPSYVVRLRAAQQAAQNAVSSARDDLRPQYPYWPTMWVAVAVALSILLFLKLRYG